MRLTCIDRGVRRKGVSGSVVVVPSMLSGHADLAQRRGAAEVEAVLVIGVLLIPILLLFAAASDLGRNVLDHCFAAENNAYTMVVSGGEVTAIDDPSNPAPDGVVSRYVLSNPGEDAKNGTVLYLPAKLPFNYKTPGTFLDPTWHLSSFPESNFSLDDHLKVVGLLTPFQIDDPSGPSIAASLGLQPVGPP
jgi:hypothetical protein